MLQLSVLLAFLAATSVNSIPIPLNINLGAFSPALVVGDGEVSSSLLTLFIYILSLK